MKILALMIYVIASLNFSQTVKLQFEDMIPAVSKNKLTFERVTCKTFPGSKVTSTKCRIKYIDRKNVKIDVSGYINESITDAWANALVYYKYNTYQRIAVNLWENVCDWVAGKTKSYIAEWTFGRVLNYTNFYHSCPYIGYVYVKVDNISLDTFTFPPIVPSGRYRLDFTVTESDRSKKLWFISLYASVSDHRIEVV